MSTDSTPPWYYQGLRFTCTQCGNCCSGSPGWVWFTPAEGKRMAARLEMNTERFHREYARELNGAWALRERHSEYGFDCALLDRGSEPGKALCSVYEDRPKQCRTWPFWWVNTRSERDWKEAKNSTPCPGMDEGELISPEEIRRKLDS